MPLALFRRPFAALAAACALMASAVAQSPTRPDADEAIARIERLMSDAAAVYADDALGEAEKDAAFAALLGDAFALDFMSTYALRGREDALDAAQRAAYGEAFPAYFAASFASQFGAIAQRPFATNGVDEVGARDLMVRSMIERDGAKDVAIDWRMRQFEDGPKAVDVIASGSSILLARRRDIAAVLETQGPDGLIAALQKRS